MESVLWVLLYAGLFYLMMRYGCGAHMSHGGHGSHSGHSPEDTAVKDPVCGMGVAPNSGYRLMYEGEEYRFCSRKCLDQFESDPATYVAMKKSA